MGREILPPLATGAADVLLAAAPVAFILLALIKLRAKLWQAGGAALLLTALLALAWWRMPVLYIADALAEGAFLAFCPVIWVIFAALFTYNLSVEAGAMDTIRAILTRVSDDRRIQVLIIAFAFGGFLEAAAGFGTAVAIPAAMLVALGFEAGFAAVICLAANTVPVAFGVMGIPIITLANVTELPLGTLAVYTAVQLFPLAVCLPVFLAALAAGGLRKAKAAIPAAAAGGLAFGAAQTAVAVAGAPELAAMAGAFAALAAILIVNKIKPLSKAAAGERVGAARGLRAAGPYLIMLALAVAVSLAPALARFKGGAFRIAHTFYPGGAEQGFAWLTNPGTLFLLAGVIGACIYGLSPAAVLRVLGRTAKRLLPSAAAIVFVLCVARVMFYSGMIGSVAGALAATGVFFPVISPLLGALGTLITGSDTSSNVLFGPLQKQTAINAGLNAAWLSAANASGATIGKMVSPQSISVASAAIGLAGREHAIMRRMLKYAGVMTLALAVIVLAGAAVIALS